MNILSRIIFSSSEIVIDNKQEGKSPFTDLQKGQILKATVLESLSSRNATLLVEGTKVTAKTHLPLIKGDSILLKVTQTGNQPVFKIVTADANAPKQFSIANLVNLNRNEPYQGILKFIDATIAGKTVPDKQNIAPVIHNLKNTINTSSIQKDVMTQLGNLKQINFDSPDKNAVNLAKSLVDIKQISNDLPKHIKPELNTPISLPRTNVDPDLTDHHSKLQSNENRLRSLKISQTLSQIKDIVNKLPLKNEISAQLQTLAKINFATPGHRAMQFSQSLVSLKQHIDALPSPQHLLQPSEPEGLQSTASEKSLLITYAKTVKARMQLTRDIALKSDRPDPHFLNNLIQKSGMTWENKLLSALETKPSTLLNNPLLNVEDDLKALTLKLNQSLPASSEGLHKSIQDFADNIEKLQLLNKTVFDDTGKLIFPFPVLFENSFRFGQLLIDLNQGSDQQKSKENQTVKVSVLLEMTQLGHLRADLTIFKKSIAGSFGVMNEDIQKYVQENIPVLKNMIQHHGFDVHDISVMVLAPETLANTSLIDEMVTHQKSTFHFVI